MASATNERRGEENRRRRMNLLSSIIFAWKRVEMERQNEDRQVYIYGIFTGVDWVIQENRITKQILPML
jgi:hypothetical protein